MIWWDFTEIGVGINFINLLYKLSTQQSLKPAAFSQIFRMRQWLGFQSIWIGFSYEPGQELS